MAVDRRGNAMSLALRNPPGHGWIVVNEPRPRAAVRLICCPYAGGGAHVFRAWATRLPPWIEVLAVEPPGRGTRFNELPMPSLDVMVESLASAIAPALDRPYALFGHSLGALVAFQLTCALRRRQSRGPYRLLVSGRGAPGRPRRKPPIHHLPDPAFLAAIDAYNGWPEEVRRHRELVDLLLPILRADFAMVETYKWFPEAPVDCDISAYHGTSDAEVHAEDVQAWSDLTSARFAMTSFEGDHFFLRSHEGELLSRIATDLRLDVRTLARAAT
jgi:medium-chain acyl-[acyl-carrier-protein] hydrolase